MGEWFLAFIMALAIVGSVFSFSQCEQKKIEKKAECIMQKIDIEKCAYIN